MPKAFLLSLLAVLTNTDTHTYITVFYIHIKSVENYKEFCKDLNVRSPNVLHYK